MVRMDKFLAEKEGFEPDTNNEIKAFFISILLTLYSFRPVF